MIYRFHHKKRLKPRTCASFNRFQHYFRYIALFCILHVKLHMMTGQKPSKNELSAELDDFLFGIIENAVDAEISGEEYEMPEDEAFEDEIDKTDIITVDNYVPRYLNQAITFSIKDIGGDEAALMVMCYMMIVIIAFIFAVTISNTIVSEAGVIGTLRASGYTKGELIRHYMILPIIVSLSSITP